MVYLEAQACGLPVVAFDNGGIPEVVDQDNTGFLTPLRCQEPFVRALERLIGRTELRRKMGRAAVQHVRAHHDLAVNYQKINPILGRICTDFRTAKERR